MNLTRYHGVFDIDIETCRVCGGSMKVIACIEDPVVTKKILTHLRSEGLYLEAAGLPQSRAPPQDDLFSWDTPAGQSTYLRLRP